VTDRTRLTTVETVREEGSWLFTVEDPHGADEEVVLVPCEDDDAGGVEAWVNRCTHEAQRLDRGFGAAMRDVHGSPRTLVSQPEISDFW